MLILLSICFTMSSISLEGSDTVNSLAVIVPNQGAPGVQLILTGWARQGKVAVASGGARATDRENAG